jgi:cell shape-determining protein MreC
MRSNPEMSKLKRRILIFLIFVSLMLAAILCFFSYGAYFSFSKERREIAVAAVNAAPALPERFVQIYAKANPGYANSFL